MKIQSLSVVVPGSGCINNCPYCVSKTRNDDELYVNQLEQNLPFYDLYLNDYIKRLEFCRDNGCNTIVLTGNIEPQQNKRFLVDFGLMMRLMERPFRNIEIQTTGVTIDKNMLRFLRNHVGVNTIALSINSMSDVENREYLYSVQGNRGYCFTGFCEMVKTYDFNLRLCLNLTEHFNRRDIDLLFDDCKKLGADQVTLRKLYAPVGKVNSPQSLWIATHSIEPYRYKQIQDYVTSFPSLRKLEYGQTAYSVKGMSVICDSDCMAKNTKKHEDFKYLILRPNGKLYGLWDDPASLIF